LVPILICSIPLSMAIYLAKTFAKTNKELEERIVTIQEMSDKQLEQERYNTELKIQSELNKLENERKSEELEEARQLQLSMLPKVLPQLPNLDIAVFMKTATEVGGDYYDFRVGVDGILNIALGDATGHGLQAGTLVTIMKGIFTLESENSDVLSFFEKSVKTLKEIKLGRLMMAFVFLKIRGNQLSLSDAGVPPVYIYRHNNNEVEEIDNKGMPLGAMNNYPYKETKTELNTGDVILLLSDGFPELKNKEKEHFGYERVIKTFKETGERSAEAIIEHLRNTVKEWSGVNVPEDDVTFVVIKVK
jgi:serine phosphatase RsbU (regulator of sigma subunit)